VNFQRGQNAPIEIRNFAQISRVSSNFTSDRTVTLEWTGRAHDVFNASCKI